MKLFIRCVALGVVALGLFLSIWWIDWFRETPASQYHVKGKFGPVISWPITPIHVTNLPDGRVLSFGTDLRGRQGAQFHYDVWDPKKGTGWDSHLILPNTVGTDTFCAGQLVIPSDDSVLIVGGDRIVKGERNWSSPDINFFDGKTNTLRSAGRTMERPRWYPTVVTMGNGDVVVAGGRLDPTHYAPLPELYSPPTGWRTLPGAENAKAFGEPNWNYPRMWLDKEGKLFVLSVDGSAYRVDPEGQGSIKPLNVAITKGHPYLPSVMYLPGKILATRWLGKTFDIDINGEAPDVKTAAWSGLGRFNASLTIMADGNVLFNGGGLLNNASLWYLAPSYESKIWHADTGKWANAAIAKRMRMYHSTSILQPDGTILTGGGGAPGPQENLNAEIYYPPYLFKNDESGQFAERPVLQSAPDFASWGKSFEIQMNTQDVSKINLIRVGSVTHTNNFDQRFMPLVYKPLGGGRFAVEAPANSNLAPPGYYYLFVLNKAGVPAIARQVKLSH
jgi:hypothetical protein